MTPPAPALTQAPPPAAEPREIVAIVHDQPAPSPARSLWSGTLVFAGRHLQHIRQIPEKLLDVTVQPLMFVLLFAYVFGGAIAVEGGSYREYIIAGILVQSLAFGLTGPATSIATDLTEGVVDRFRSLPVARVSYLLGHYVAELAGLALSIVVLLGAGLVVGWRAHTGIGDLALAGLLLLVFASAMIWLGTALGLSVRTPDAVMGVAFVVVFPITFISAAFVPIASMPDVLQWVASWNPITIMVTAMRELFGNPTGPVARATWPVEHPVAGAFLCCAVVLALAVPASLARYRQRTSD